MPIISSTVTEGPAQADGRRHVTERHTDETGQVYVFEWLGSQAAQPVMEARVAMLNAQLQAQADAAAAVAGTLLPMTKLQFRELFTFTERMGIDELHATFEVHPGLTGAQKAMLRTALEDYRMASNIRRPFDLARIGAMLDMYVALGLLTPARRTEILAAGNA